MPEGEIPTIRYCKKDITSMSSHPKLISWEVRQRPDVRACGFSSKSGNSAVLLANKCQVCTSSVVTSKGLRNGNSSLGAQR